MKTTEIAIVFIFGSLTLAAFVFFLMLIIIEYRRRQVRYITEKLQMKHEYESQVLQTQIEVQEQSFKYFSEEVHDNIAQMLSLVRLKLYKIAGKANDEVIQTGIETSNELLSKILNDLRSLSHVLNGSLVSKIPLTDSLEKELGYVKGASDIEINLVITGSPHELSAEKRLLVFRIIQEAIGNAIKHGKANEINITLAYNAGTITVAIHDNGVGFDTQLLHDSKGLGLHNMRLRARLLGDIEVISEQYKGTTITLKINTNEG